MSVQFKTYIFLAFILIVSYSGFILIVSYSGTGFSDSNTLQRANSGQIIRYQFYNDNRSDYPRQYNVIFTPYSGSYTLDRRWDNPYSHDLQGEKPSRDPLIFESHTTRSPEKVRKPE